MRGTPISDSANDNSINLNVLVCLKILSLNQIELILPKVMVIPVYNSLLFDYEVLTATGYESLTGFIHKGVDETLEYVELDLEDFHIRVSENHLVFLADGETKRAGDIQVH